MTNNNMKLYDLVIENHDGSISKKVVMGTSLRSVRAEYEDKGEIFKLKESAHTISKDEIGKALIAGNFDGTDINIIISILEMSADFIH